MEPPNISSSGVQPTGPQLPVIVQPKIRSLDDYVQDLSAALKNVQTANRTIQATIKPLELAEERAQVRRALVGEADKPVTSLRNGHTPLISRDLKELEKTISTHEKTIADGFNRISAAEELLKSAQVDPRIKGWEQPTPQVKKIQALMKKLDTEIHKQDELALQNIEKKLSAITGNSIFNSIFRIKRVSSDDIPHLQALHKKIKDVETRPGRTQHSDRILRLKEQVGRALLLAHGFRTEKDLTTFLNLMAHELPVWGINNDDALLMADFVRARYHKNTQKLESEIQRLAIIKTVEALEATPSLSEAEYNEGWNLLRRLIQTPLNHPAIDDIQKLYLRLHQKLEPNYFEKLETIFSINPITIDSVDYAINYVILQQYLKVSEFHQEATNYLSLLLLARHPKFLEKAKTDLEALKVMHPRSLQIFDLETKIKQLGFMAENNLSENVKRTAVTLKQGYEELLLKKQKYDEELFLKNRK